MHELERAVRERAGRFGPALARASFARGLAVTDPSGAVHPIPITATPVVLDGAEVQRRAELSARLSSSALKMSRAALAGRLDESILPALSPLERHLALKGFAQLRRLATTRVDYLVDERPVALEINATIPAMQGYSDIAAESFIESVGREAGLDAAQIAALVEKNGSNARALHQTLIACFAEERSGLPQRIALLCRRNDAQQTELEYLARRFSEWGPPAELVFPDEIEPSGPLSARGKRFDLVYRHLFVRRLESTPSPRAVELLENPSALDTAMYNAPASQVEVKTVFALLSRTEEEPALADAAALDDAEREAIRAAVPWTRVLRPGIRTRNAEGADEDLLRWVAREPARFVLKRAWDYGGKAVFVGSSADEPEFADRVTAAFGQPMDWAELCARAASDARGGGFIVQQRIPSHPQPHLLCSGQRVEAAALYVDYSGYASVGAAGEPRWGGVCRGSLSRVVNIAAGGGVLPLIDRSVADALAIALARSSAPPIPEP